MAFDAPSEMGRPASSRIVPPHVGRPASASSPPYGGRGRVVPPKMGVPRPIVGTRYRGDPDQLVADHLGIAATIARSHSQWARYGYDLDDLQGAAHVGLIEAARSWDPDRGVPFAAWASTRIRGAIIDDLRAWAGRSARTATRRGERLDRPTSLDALDLVGESIADQARPVDETVELTLAVAAGVSACRDDIDRDVLAALLADRTMSEVARAHGRTVPGVCWRADRLRAAMRRAAVPTTPAPTERTA